MAAYVKALEAFDAAEEALEETSGLIADAGPDGPIVFVTDDGLLWYPSASVSCVGRTKRGLRCRNEVFDQGQVWRWRGPFAVLEEEWIGRLLSQTCRVHDDGRADYEPPEWVRVPVDSRLVARFLGEDGTSD